ncbi:MAG: SLC13 family permease [Bacteroidales bacterium]|nr:SLC13 family permease [Bacteroidales bacterium]
MKLLISTIIFLIVWLLPTTAFGVEGLTVIEQRVIAIFVLAAVLWIMEPIPIWGTSVVIMVMMLLTTSDSMLSFFNDNLGIEELAKMLGISESSEALTKEAVTKAMKGFTYYDGEKIPILSAKSIMASFADPTVMLFMGGFVLAIAATKYKLDATLARTILKPFGKKPKFVMLGFLVVTALLSMFMSNTATAAMMIAILTPVLASMPESDNAGRVGLALSIPVAANIGGIGSPIGTPPNVVAVGNLAKEGIDISFGNWMMIMVPVAMLILFLAWLFLNWKFPCKQESIEIKIEGEVDKSPKAMIVYITFAVTILLWVFGKELLGVNANTVALVPFAVFCITGVFEKKDLAKIDWDVLWLVAGGFALGVGLDAKIGPDGLTMSKHIVGAIPFDSWPTLAIILGSGVLCLVMSTFMSNSATAALLIPIFVALGKGMSDQLEPYGGVTTLIVGLALSASFAMSLPISTPPNAIAYSKGFIKQKEMVLVGIVVGIISLVIGYTVLFSMGGLLK